MAAHYYKLQNLNQGLLVKFRCFQKALYFVLSLITTKQIKDKIKNIIKFISIQGKEFKQNNNNIINSTQYLNCTPLSSYGKDNRLIQYQLDTGTSHICKQMISECNTKESKQQSNINSSRRIGNKGLVMTIKIKKSRS